MHKNGSIRDEIRQHTDKQIPPNVIFIISQKLAVVDRNMIKQIIVKTEKIQEERNNGRKPPVKRLSFRICEEVIKDDKY